MNIGTDRIEKKVRLTYFFPKGYGTKLVHKEFVCTLQDNAISLSDHQFLQNSHGCTFFGPNGRLIVDALPKGSKYTQDYSIYELLPALNQVRTGNARLKVTPTLMVHMNNSICHNGAKIPEKMPVKGLGRTSHPIYSRDINPVTSGHSESLKE
jgi:hypothetical protein